MKKYFSKIKCPGKIESVNGAMLKSLLEEESDLVVFMFREDNRSDGWMCNLKNNMSDGYTTLKQHFRLMCNIEVAQSV